MFHMMLEFGQWLARHDVPQRDKIKIVLVVPDARTEYHLRTALKADCPQPMIHLTEAELRGDQWPNELMGIPFDIWINKP